MTLHLLRFCAGIGAVVFLLVGFVVVPLLPDPWQGRVGWAWLAVLVGGLLALLGTAWWDATA